MMETSDRQMKNRQPNICRDCALMAIEMIDRQTQRRDETCRLSSTDVS
jgi:hypothetical protein